MFYSLGDWGLGVGDWGLGPIPNPQSPIPNPQSPINKKYKYFLFFKNILHIIKKSLSHKIIIYFVLNLINGQALFYK